VRILPVAGATSKDGNRAIRSKSELQADPHGEFPPDLSSTASGTLPANTTGRARRSMLRTWPVSTSPAIASPGGSTTLLPNGLMRVVIGQTMANSAARQNSPGDTTRAGRRPLCSLPTRGSKSVHNRSPAFGR
jgi:hypothetical protein